MRNLASILIIGLCLFLTACDVVYTEQPLGGSPAQLDKEIWEGSWRNEEVVLLTTVIDAEKGILQAAGMERTSKGVELKTFTGIARQTGDMLFFNMLDEELLEDQENTEPLYLWALADNDGGRIVFWFPKVETFKARLTDGSFPGTIKDKNVILGQLKTKHLEMISSPSEDLLEWLEPGVYVRIGD